MNRELRKKAEQQLYQSEQETEKELQELRIHQIELEMQNEELQRIQLQLEDEKKRYYNLYNMAPCGYLSLDQGAVIRRCNQSFSDMLGILTSPVGKAFSDFILKEDKDTFLGRYHAFFREPGTKKIDLRLVATGNKNHSIWVQLTGRRETMKEHSMLLLVVTDVSEIKSAHQKVSALLDEKSILLKEVHHRIKNNLALIGASISITVSNDQECSILELIRARLNIMADLYDILFHSGEYGRIFLPAYIRDIGGLHEEMYHDASEKWITYTMDDVTVSEKTALVIGIIISEIITNSVKHASSNSEMLFMNITLKIKDEHSALIQISDNGMAIPYEKAEPTDSGGFGSELIEALSSYLKGSVNTERLDTGFRITVSFSY